jgi:SAM-dependent methyltransferase
MPTEKVDRWGAVNAAFSKQSVHFEAGDFSNPVLQEWRKRIYAHVNRFIKPNSRILELNAGTGIDAAYFSSQGHKVHATDLSAGMIAKLKEKEQAFSKNITVQQVSFDQLNLVDGKFDFVFSNFGGLNCIEDLQDVTKHLPRRLNEGAFVTCVVMPRISPWEWTWILKGKFGDAFRRLQKGGVVAHLEEEYFYTYYHSVGEVESSFGSLFQLLRSEALGVFSPPPAAQKFARRFPRITNFLSRIDHVLSNSFPFNRWGDHVIVTLKFEERNH